MRNEIINLINTGTVDIRLLYNHYVNSFGAIDPMVFKQAVMMYAQRVGIIELYRFKIEEYNINILRKDSWFKAV